MKRRNIPVRASSSEAVGRENAIVHECGRCGRTHHGATPGPGWSDHPDFDKLCDDCSESVTLAARLGMAA